MQQQIDIPPEEINRAVEKSLDQTRKLRLQDARKEIEQNIHLLREQEIKLQAALNVTQGHLRNAYKLLKQVKKAI